MLNTSVFTIPVWDDDGSITGKMGTLIVGAREIVVVDGDECEVGTALWSIGIPPTHYPEARRYNRKTDTIERYARHYVVYGFDVFTHEPLPPMCIVWQRVE